MVCGACQSIKPMLRSEETADYCASTVPYEEVSAFLPTADLEMVLQADTVLTHRFTSHDLRVANAAGVVPLLRTLTGGPSPRTEADRLERSARLQQLHSRLTIAAGQIAGVAAELDCEGERADRLATYLDQLDSRRVRRLTILSVIAGGVTSVVTAFVESPTGSKVAGIGGGLLSAGLGGAAAFSSNQTTYLNHSHNLLTDIWQQPQASTLYPPFVWYMLNQKAFSNDGQHSISFNNRERWKTYVLTDSPAKEQALYFGNGGAYTAEQLHRRANMVNQLQASVRSLSQDLSSLELNVAKQLYN